MTTRAATEDPLKAFRFRIEIDGVTRAGFTECTGLSRETEIAEYREGGMNDTPQKSAGLSRYPNIVLKRGQIIGSAQGGDDDFLIWAQDVHDVSAGGNTMNYRRNLDIVQYDALNQEVRRWPVYEAWPCKLIPFGDLNAMSSENLVETLELAHEGFSPPASAFRSRVSGARVIIGG